MPPRLAGQVPAAVAEVRRAKALAFVLERATVVDTTGAPVDLRAIDPAERMLVEFAEKSLRTHLIGREAAGRNDTMDMRMNIELLTPRV